MTYVPLSLIILRLCIGIFLLIIPFLYLSYYAELMIVLLITGLLSDIFDGIIARRLGVSNERLRRLDSSADQIFWICVIISTYLIAPAFFHEHKLSLAVLAIAEALTYALSLLKFKKEVSTHAILSKIWTLSMLAVFIEVIATGNSGWQYWLCFTLGLISRIEIAAIILTLKEWTTDVPSLYHATRLRKGQPIRRNRFFNG